MKKIYPLSALILVLLLTSCNNLHIAKRHYRNGFYVNLNNDREPREAVTNESQMTEVTAEATVQTVRAAEPAEVTTQENNPQSTPNTADAPSVVPATKVADEKPSESTPAEQTQSSQQVAQQSEAPPAPADAMLIIQVILCFFIPPLAIYLKEGITGRFWIDLICALLGGGFFFYPWFGGLWLVAVVLALLVVLDVI